MPDSILSENRDGVLIVTLNRPEKKNAIDNPMWMAIRDTFRHAAEDDDVSCVLLLGAGENFCSGVDLASFGDDSVEDPQALFNSAALAVAELEKNGFELVRMVHAANLNTGFIFVTAYDEYAIEAIRSSAFDYLLKPVDPDDLRKSLTRFNEQLDEHDIKQQLGEMLQKNI